MRLRLLEDALFEQYTLPFQRLTTFPDDKTIYRDSFALG